MFRKVAGTRDILPDEAFFWQELEKISRNIFSLYNYQEIRPPLIEEASLFNRSLGESTEIVRKQMFLVKNKNENYALRPEATASVVRAYVENNLDKASGFVKLYYMGPMFRLERPQKGRLRQFNHIGCEAIGSQDADLDVEVISLADALLRAYPVEGYQIKINSLGCPEDQKRLSGNLQKALKGKLNKLCEDCRKRFKINILRILDCKNTSCKELVADLGIDHSHLCNECAAHLSRVKKGLDLLKINYSISAYLVRGLDYYSRTVFEITHPQLGAQDALGAGGRYNNLVKELGGPDLGAIGFALGVERLLLVQSHKSEVTSKNLIYLVTLGDKAKYAGMKLLADLRKAGIACDTDYENKSLKGALRCANDLASRFVVIIGEDELNKDVVTLKDMQSGEQREVKSERLIQELATHLKRVSGN